MEDEKETVCLCGMEGCDGTDCQCGTSCDCKPKTQEELFNAGKNLIDSIIDRALTKYQLLYLCSQFEEFQELGI